MSGPQSLAVERKPSPASIRIVWLFGCIVAVALIGWADGETGEDIGLSVFYFVPVVIAGWFSGRIGAVVIAATSVAAWTFCEYVWWNQHTPLGEALNGGFRLVSFAVVGLTACQVRLDRDAREQLNRKLEVLLARESADARTDALTGLANRRSFLETLRTEISRDQREGRSLCLLLLDLDNFKQVNDRFGHDKGDAVLQQVAQLMRRMLRSADVPARLGGDEFAALLWNTDDAEAKFITDRLVEGIGRLAADYPGTNLGASAGVIISNSLLASPEDLLHDADETMYKAKRGGKHRTEIIHRGKTSTGRVVNETERR